MESDKEEDEDIDAPSIDDLTFFADLLRKGTPRKRLKGPVGDALRELSKIEARIAEGNLSAEERAHLHFRLWGLNGRADDKSPSALRQS